MAQKRITDLDAAAALLGAELLELSMLSDTITITATTISAQASDNSFNDSGSGFVTAGFAVGDRVNVAGFTGDVANNLFVGVITVLTTGKMTIGGTDGDVIVDDAAGESVTITKWVSRRTSIADVLALAPAAAAVVTTETGTAANLLAADAGTYTRWTNTGAKTLTVQPDATEPQEVDSEWHIRNVGAADLTISEGSGVTVNAPNGGTLAVPQGGTVTLKCVATDEYDLLGQTVAA